MLDNDGFHWAFCGFQLQTELLLKRGKDGGPGRSERGGIVHSRIAALRLLSRPLDFDIVAAIEPGLIYDGAINSPGL
jgi:hypothetical protein